MIIRETRSGSGSRYGSRNTAEAKSKAKAAAKVGGESGCRGVSRSGGKDVRGEREQKRRLEFHS